MENFEKKKEIPNLNLVQVELAARFYGVKSENISNDMMLGWINQNAANFRSVIIENPGLAEKCASGDNDAFNEVEEMIYEKAGR